MKAVMLFCLVVGTAIAVHTCDAITAPPPPSLHTVIYAWPLPDPVRFSAIDAAEDSKLQIAVELQQAHSLLTYEPRHCGAY